MKRGDPEKLFAKLQREHFSLNIDISLIVTFELFQVKSIDAPPVEKCWISEKRSETASRTVCQSYEKTRYHKRRGQFHSSLKP